MMCRLEYCDAGKAPLEGGRSVEPCFIVGVGRSGTTLLANLLGSHPSLTPIYETAFLRNLILLCESAQSARGAGVGAFLLGRWRQYRISFKSEKYRRKCAQFAELFNSFPRGAELVERRIKQPYESFRFEDTHILFAMDAFIAETDRFIHDLRQAAATSSAAYQCARLYIERVFAQHCERAQKPYWINKTPRLLLCLDGLYKLFPTARCIHIVRDGRDVVASNLSLSWGPDNVREGAMRWRDRLKGRKTIDRTAAAFKEIRYEDLIAAPRRVLDGAFSFLGLRADVDEILGHFDLYDQRVGAWRNVFDRQARKTFADVAGELLIELGYEENSSWVA